MRSCLVIVAVSSAMEANNLDARNHGASYGVPNVPAILQTTLPPSYEIMYVLIARTTGWVVSDLHSKSSTLSPLWFQRESTARGQTVYPRSYTHRQRGLIWCLPGLSRFAASKSRRGKSHRLRKTYSAFTGAILSCEKHGTALHFTGLCPAQCDHGAVIQHRGTRGGGDAK